MFGCLASICVCVFKHTHTHTQSNVYTAASFLNGEELLKQLQEGQEQRHFHIDLVACLIVNCQQKHLLFITLMLDRSLNRHAQQNELPGGC